MLAFFVLELIELDACICVNGAVQLRCLAVDAAGNDIPGTVISKEFSTEWKSGMEPYYPVNDEENGALYEKYRKLAEQEENVIFGGRLGTYKYYNMDQVVAQALELCEKELGRRISIKKG